MINSTLYICGPMTGLPDHNFPAFNDAAARWRKMGHNVVNPAELDEEDQKDMPWDYYLRRDIKRLTDCSGVVILAGSSNSKGSTLEIMIARFLGMKVICDRTKEVIDNETADSQLMACYEQFVAKKEIKPLYSLKAKESILDEANKLVNGDRAKAYGHPKQDFDRTAGIWSQILGVAVKAEQVALCMIGVKISRQCNAPKRDNWVDIAGYAQTGQMVNEAEAK